MQVQRAQNVTCEQHKRRKTLTLSFLDGLSVELAPRNTMRCCRARAIGPSALGILGLMRGIVKINC